MPSQPNRSQVHVNRPLTNISIAYIQSAEDFVASKAFPVVPVMKQADRYFVYTKGYWFRTASQKRAPGAESAGSGFAIDNTPSYFADVWSVHKDVDDQTRENADEPLNMDRDATLFVTQQQLLRKEILFVARYFATSVWTGSTTGSDITPSPKWDTATGDPLKDVDAQKVSIKKKTGFKPNTLTVCDDVFYAIKNNPLILDRIKYTQTGVVTEQLLAALFQMQKFLVASAIVNNAAEGATDSMGFLATKLALLTYGAPSPSILQPSAGYTFAWRGLYGAGADGGRIKSFRMEHLASDRIESDMAFDLKLVAADLGCLFVATIS